MHHHYVDATRGFGISTPTWDLVLGTQKRQKGETKTRFSQSDAPIANAIAAASGAANKAILRGKKAN